MLNCRHVLYHHVLNVCLFHSLAELEFVVNDTLMRYFDKCERFVKEVESNKSALEEVKHFNEGPEMKRVMEKIADRLEVPYTSVTDDSVEAGFFLCAYEFAIQELNSPWCQLFDEVDAQVMEYAGDLKQYWKRSYGHDINSKSSCILFHDLFHRLDRIVAQIKLWITPPQSVVANSREGEVHSDVEVPCHTRKIQTVIQVSWAL